MYVILAAILKQCTQPRQVLCPALRSSIVCLQIPFERQRRACLDISDKFVGLIDVMLSLSLKGTCLDATCCQ